MSTMLLFTTMPASAMMPMPTITMPKVWPVTMSPIGTPDVEKRIADSTRPAWYRLLNCVTRIIVMRKIADTKAVSRKFIVSACSSASPANRTTSPPLTLTGRRSTSSTSSMTPGTFSTGRPAPVSMAPAVTRRLLFDTRPMSSAKSTS